MITILTTLMPYLPTPAGSFHDRKIIRFTGVCRALSLRLLLVLVLAMLCNACPSPVTTPAPKAGSWLVFLCQASDAPAQPHAVSFYQELFDKNQRDLLFDYFQKVSNSAVDVSATEIYGWFSMGVATATIAPAVRNNATNPNRSQTAQDCKSAGVAALLATGKNLDPSRYAGFIAVVNVPVDAGQTGQSVVANAEEPAAFYSHEMLHALGLLQHSNSMAADRSSDHSWESGVDSEYRDCWDIMSYDTCSNWAFATTNHLHQGPELGVAYKQILGWVTNANVFVKDARDISPSTVTLLPVSESTTTDPLMAAIELPTGEKYVVEYHVPTGFDRAIPGAAVVIRELRSNRTTYLVKRITGETGLVTGDRFTDVAHFLSITVSAMTPHSATIVINPRHIVPAQIGDICGNKFLGQIRSCPVGAICDAHRSPQTQSIDYFCQ